MKILVIFLDKMIEWCGKGRFSTGFSVLALFASLLLLKDAQASCLDEINSKCLTKGDALSGCSSQFGRFIADNFGEQVGALVNRHLTTSMEYLLIANKFSEWDHNRPGFSRHFNKLSDDAWEDAVDLIQHMVIRGQMPKLSVETPYDDVFSKSEVELLGFAHAREETLASDISNIIKSSHTHHHETGEPRTDPDPELYHYLSEHLSDKRVMKVKTASNLVNTLYAAMFTGKNDGWDDGNDHALAVHWFDTIYLK